MRKFDYIFGVGPGKSGTHSLLAALTFFDLDVCHFGQNTYQNDGQPVLCQHVLNNAKIGKKLLDGVPRFDAYVDYPICDFIPELDTQYPDALFILTFRPPEDAAFSWARMCLAQKLTHWPQQNRFSEYITSARRVYDTAFNIFDGRPEKMLVLDTRIAGATNMKKIANFLDLPLSDKFYPHAFDHKDWYSNERHNGNS